MEVVHETMRGDVTLRILPEAPRQNSMGEAFFACLMHLIVIVHFGRE